jgi:hypothetical protein
MRRQSPSAVRSPPSAVERSAARGKRSALFVAAALLLGAAEARADFRWGERYSHAGHGQAMGKKGQASPECRACHFLDARTFAPIAPGALDHKPCVDCHRGSEFSRGPRCLTCHSSVRAFKPGKPWFPPYRSPGEFHVTFSHPRHVELLAASRAGEQCGGCHLAQDPAAPSGAKSGFGHGACATCHAGQAAPDMNDCGGCHRAGPPERGPRPIADKPGPYRTTERFDHLRHAADAKKRGQTPVCTSCHVGLAAQNPPGRPRMESCESCHDGQRAFDARGTGCARCHTAPAGFSATAQARPPQRFSHAQHRQNGIDMAACGGCHAPGEDGQKVHAGRDEHRPCQGCHAAEFRRAGAKLCLGCHQHGEPFTPNPLRPPARDGNEWRLIETPHPPHIAARLACGVCHPDEAGLSDAPRADHALCGRCHKTGAPTPLSRCAGCHVPVATPRVSRPLRAWSTRAAFRHDDTHRKDNCATCHLAGGAADLTPPRMAACAERCHDGATAFKVTGFGCARCHGGAR